MESTTNTDEIFTAGALLICTENGCMASPSFPEDLPRTDSIVDRLFRQFPLPYVLFRHCKSAEMEASNLEIPEQPYILPRLLVMRKFKVHSITPEKKLLSGLFPKLNLLAIAIANQ